MGNLQTFNRKFTALGFVTLFFEKLNAALVQNYEGKQCKLRPFFRKKIVIPKRPIFLTWAVIRNKFFLSGLKKVIQQYAQKSDGVVVSSHLFVSVRFALPQELPIQLSRTVRLFPSHTRFSLAFIFFLCQHKIKTRND